jgi:hypothetical protein
MLIVTCDQTGQVYFWANTGTQQGKLLGLYPAAFRVLALHWFNDTHLIMADTGGPRNKPNMYQLKVEVM